MGDGENVKFLKGLFSYDRELTSITDEGGRKLTLFSLALPIFFETALRTMMNTVNAMILSRYSETAAGAIGTATTLLNFIMMLFSMISTGVTVIIVQNLSAGNRKRAGEAATLSVVFCAGMSLVLGVLLAGFAPQLMNLMNLEGQQLAEAVEYFAIVCKFNVISSLITVFAAITRSYGQTRINFVIALLMNGFNALFCAIVVFRPFETPLHGISGVAVARVLAEAAACLINIVFVSKMHIGFSLKSILKPDWTLIKQIFQFGIPSGIGGFSYSISSIVTTAIIGGLGTLAVTTKTYVSSVAFYSALISSALGQATSILIGRNVGRGDMDRAYRLCLQSVKVSVLCNTIFAMILCLFAQPIFKLFFNASDEIIVLARNILAVDILVEAGRAMNNVEDNALRASGDVVFQAAVGLSSCWLLSVLFAYIFVRCGMGLYGVWIAFAMDECGRGLTYMLRWRSKKWMSKRIISEAESSGKTA